MRPFIVAVFFVGLMSSSAAAIDLRTGDVLTGWITPAIIGAPFPGAVFRLRAGETYRPLVYFQAASDVPVVATNLSGQVFVLEGGTMRRYDANGEVIGAFALGPQFSWAQVFTFDAAGYLFIQGNDGLYKLDQQGNVIRRFPVLMSAFDLATDQCTMYYTAQRALSRYDVCSGQRLPDIATGLPSSGWNLRLLPDGSVLIALGLNNAIRVAPDGSTMKTYNVLAYGLALGIDGRSFWAGPGVNNVDLETGAVTIQWTVPSPTNSVAVIGEPRAANGFAPQSVPATAPTTLALLAIAIVVAAVVSLQR